jgi:hypothetical protein
MKKTLLVVSIIVASTLANAQRLETTLKVVSGKARIVVKAVGGAISGDRNNFIFSIGIPLANEAANMLAPTKLDALRLPTNPPIISTYSDAPGAGAKKYFNIFIDGDNTNPATFADNTEYELLELNWQGPIQSANISILSLPDGNPGAPAVPFQWLTYLEISGLNRATPPNLFYQSSSTSAPTNGADYTELSELVTTSLVTLPVSLYNFSGYKSGTANVLKWTTSSEMNSKGFEVMRSSQGTDYTSLGFVNSRAVNGTSNKELAYTFEDNSPLAAKKSYYRLRLVDLDARTAMSNIIIINGEKPKTMEIGGLFPNPANDKLNVIVSAPQRGNVTLAVMDINGKMISQKLINVEAGSNTVPVEISQLAKGNYLVKVVDRSSGSESTASKFVKQ